MRRFVIPGARGRAQAVAVLIAATLSLMSPATAMMQSIEPSMQSIEPSQSPGAVDLNSLLPEDVRTAGEIKVLTDPSFNPISFYREGSTTEIIGSDPDILRAMGDKLGVGIAFEATEFPGMLPGVQSGRGDLAGGGLTDTAEREETVDFVDNFQLGMLYVVRAGNAAGISTDLLSACGKKIAFTTGALSATQVEDLATACTEAGQPAPEQVAVSDINATLLAVRSGRVDVSFYDDFGFDAVNEAANNELEAFQITDYPRQYWGFAVSKERPELSQALLAALQAIIDDGTYASILETYNLQANALETPGINLQTTIN
jgi:polar amino acid transport system substrate-binding protein